MTPVISDNSFTRGSILAGIMVSLTVIDFYVTFVALIALKGTFLRKLLFFSILPYDSCKSVCQMRAEDILHGRRVSLDRILRPRICRLKNSIH